MNRVRTGIGVSITVAMMILTLTSSQSDEMDHSQMDHRVHERVQMDMEGYMSLLRQSIRTLIAGGTIDVEAMMAEQEDLFRRGIRACRQYLESDIPEKEKKIIQLTIQHSETMRDLPLERWRL